VETHQYSNRRHELAGHNFDRCSASSAGGHHLVVVFCVASRVSAILAGLVVKGPLTRLRYQGAASAASLAALSSPATARALSQGLAGASSSNAQAQGESFARLRIAD